MINKLNYYHVDVFSSRPLSGNGLTVVFHEEELEAQFMLKLAQEFKQFETIFLRQTAEKCFRARIFTVEEELDFAGHPVLGAASTIHEKFYPQEAAVTVPFTLNRKIVETVSGKMQDYYQATMNQGIPKYLGTVNKEPRNVILRALNLDESNLFNPLPMEVISTGLSYLIIPLASGLAQAKILINDLKAQLNKVNAKFVYIVDIAKMEGRTWDNLGAVEDVATGSAAGPVGAYLYKHKICDPAEPILLNQGRFVGRPSKITVCAHQTSGEIYVAGDVKIIVKGEIYE